MANSKFDRKFDKKNRDRQPNYEIEEISTLLEEVRERKDIILSSFTNTITNLKKAEAWEEITEMVNNSSSNRSIRRSSLDVKKKWQGLQAAAKRALSDAKRPPTGGGPVPTPPPYLDVVLDIIGIESPTIGGIIDEALDVSEPEVGKLQPHPATPPSLA